MDAVLGPSNVTRGFVRAYSTYRDGLRPVVVVVLGLDELDDDGADLLLHVAPLDQALFQKYQQRGL